MMMTINGDIQDLTGRVIEVMQDKLKFQRIQSANRWSLFEEARSLHYYFVEYCQNPILESKTYQNLFSKGFIVPGFLPNEIQLSACGKRVKIWRP